MVVRRFDVWLVTLDPTVGRGIQKTRPCLFEGKSGQVVLDQLRTVDKTRLVKRLGQLNTAAADVVLDVLSELFAR